MAVEQAEREKERTTEAVRLATAYEELTAWVRLKGVERALNGYTVRQNELFASRQAADSALTDARNKARVPLIISIALTIASVLALLVGLLWLPAFVLCACVVGGASASWIWLSRVRKRIKLRAVERDHYGTELQRLDMQRQAALQTGGDPAALQSHGQSIQQAGLEVPSSLEAGQALLAELKQRPGITDIHQSRAAAQSARDQAVRTHEQLKHAQDVADSAFLDTL